MADSIIELVYRTYYKTVFRYCRMRLNGDLHAAEDCTQEVFLVLQKKIHKLVDMESILPWLYQTADREIKRYRRKNPETVDIDEIPEPAVPSQTESPLDVLDEEERWLVEQYFGGADKIVLAGKLGISLDALYKRMQRIKRKIQGNMDDIHK